MKLANIIRRIRAMVEGDSALIGDAVVTRTCAGWEIDGKGLIGDYEDVATWIVSHAPVDAKFDADGNRISWLQSIF